MQKRYIVSFTRIRECGWMDSGPIREFDSLTEAHAYAAVHRSWPIAMIQDRQKDMRAVWSKGAQQLIQHSLDQIAICRAMIAAEDPKNVTKR